MDRDAKFSEAFRIILEQAGVKAVRLQPRSPNLNPHLERFMRSVKEACIECVIFFGERSLQVAAAEFLSHFHAERNHQGLGNRLIGPGEEVGRTTGETVCRERLGGMLRYYYREAARPSSMHRAGLSRAGRHRLGCRPRKVPRYQREKLAFRLASRWKPGFRSIDIGRESGPLPTPTIEEMRNSPASVQFHLTR